MDDFVTAYRASPRPSNKVAKRELDESVDEEIMEETLEDSFDYKNRKTQEVHVIETAEELENILYDLLPAPMEEKGKAVPVTPSPRVVKDPFLACRRRVTVPFSCDKLEKVHSNRTNGCTNVVENKCFIARIRPDDAAAAEAELSRHIGQDDFEKVNLNLQFIIQRFKLT